MTVYRYRTIETRQGTLALRDDGYRIEFLKLSDPVQQVDPEEWILWASYKQCDLQYFAAAIADVLMTMVPVTPRNADGPLAAAKPVPADAPSACGDVLPAETPLLKTRVCGLRRGHVGWHSDFVAEWADTQWRTPMHSEPLAAAKPDGDKP